MILCCVSSQTTTGLRLRLLQLLDADVARTQEIDEKMAVKKQSQISFGCGGVAARY